MKVTNEMLMEAMFEAKRYSLPDEIWTPESLGRLFMHMAHKFVSRPEYSGYVFRDDMTSHCLLHMVKSWKSFNPEKSDNAFAFMTGIMHSSVINYIAMEKKQRDIATQLELESKI